jgi:hypothetical protein
MPCTIDPYIQDYVRVNASTPREPANQPKSAIVRITGDGHQLTYSTCHPRHQRL